MTWYLCMYQSIVYDYDSTNLSFFKREKNAKKTLKGWVQLEQNTHLRYRPCHQLWQNNFINIIKTGSLSPEHWYHFTKSQKFNCKIYWWQIKDSNLC